MLTLTVAVNFLHIEQRMAENRDMSHYAIQRIAEYNSVSPEALLAAVNAIPVDYIELELHILIHQFIRSQPDKEIRRAMFNYVTGVEGASLPESITNRSRFQLSALKHLFNRASPAVQETIKRQGRRIAEIMPEHAGGYRRRTSKSKKRIHKRRKSSRRHF